MIQKNSVKAIMGENQILQQLNHPLIITMDFAFQDKENLYVLMKNYNGGDLRFHIIKHRVFNELQTKFLAACIVSALEYTHRKNILHRDIKPENLVFDDKGYLHLTDFGIAKYWRAQNAENTSGTPGYMAPEVLCHKNHSFSVDFYALGIIVYECMAGRRPHVGKSRKEILDQVMAKQAVMKETMAIGSWSPEAFDFCNRLIQRKRERRLGEQGVAEIKNHPWFAGFDWEGLVNKTLVAPFVPNTHDCNFDKKNSAKPDDKFDAKDLQMLRKKEVQGMFSGYEYNSLRTISFEKRSDVSLKQLEELAQSRTTNTS